MDIFLNKRKVTREEYQVKSVRTNSILGTIKKPTKKGFGDNEFFHFFPSPWAVLNVSELRTITDNISRLNTNR